ncbi:MAG: 4'-phosphopantetheinyl transferase family protein [Humibacter sp.]
MRVILAADGVLVGVAPRAPGTRDEVRAAGRLLLASLVAELADVDARDVVIDARCARCGLQHGRPRVTAPSEAVGIGVSVSHAEGMTVVAAALSRIVGVDVEPAHLDAERAAAIHEIAGDSPDGAEPARHWTRVEAVLKADGRGLEVDPRSILFTAIGGRRLSARVGDRSEEYTLLDVDAGDALCVTVAFAG